MKTWKLVAWAALAAGLAVTAPASASAQIGSLIKKKVKEKVVQKVAGSDTAGAGLAAPAGSPGAGPVFNSYVLEITPELLDKLEKGLAAEAAMREDNARRMGKVLSEDEYGRCKDSAILSPEGQKVSEGAVRLFGEAQTQKEREKAMQEMANRLDAFLEPRCGLEPRKAEELRSQLADRPAAAAQEATGLNERQLAILKERILPLCTATGIAEPGQVHIPTENSKIFYVYSPGEVEALRPRCGKLVEALQVDS